MENTPTGAKVLGSIGAGILNAPKKWDEQTSDEKMETLRAELIMSRYVTRRVGELEGELHRIKLHQHGDKGEVLIPLSSANANGGAGLASMYDRLA